jgi:hypothetical protein
VEFFFPNFFLKSFLSYIVYFWTSWTLTKGCGLDVILGLKICYF